MLDNRLKRLVDKLELAITASERPLPIGCGMESMKADNDRIDSIKDAIVEKVRELRRED